VLLAMTSVAHGEPVAVDPRPREAEPALQSLEGIVEQPITADDVRGAPVPGTEHGRTDSIDTGHGTARLLGRSLLFIPRVPLELVAQPVRGLLYLQGRYSIIDEIQGLFRTEGGRVAIYPTALFETGLGLNVGARARFTDLLGHGERLFARVGFGGEQKALAALELGIGGRLSAGLRLRYELADSLQFYGYGNGDVVTPTMPIDPLTSEDAVSTEFDLELFRVSPYVKYQLSRNLSLTASGALTQKSFSPDDVEGDDFAIDQAFMVDRIPGFASGTTFAYTELEVAWNTRRRAHAWDAPGMRGTGGLVLGFIGRQHHLGEDEPSYYRIGVDLQRYLRLAVGPRVLELRAYGELVTGARDEVPFSELPRLGGSSLLRGYESGRFRDRVAIVTQASYAWAVSSWLAPSVFVDVGRVYSGLDDLSLDHPRAGFGAALEAYSKQRMFIRAEVASSLDGGVFVYLTLNPAFDAYSRAERN